MKLSNTSNSMACVCQNIDIADICYRKNSLYYIFAIIFFLATSKVAFNQTIQTGVSNGTQIRIPVSTNSMYSYSQQIIQKEKIIESGVWTSSLGNITRLRYYITNSNFIGLANSDTWKIYMGTTSKTKFDSINDWVSISSMSLVFDGQVIAPQGSGWWDIILQTPFDFDGSENLIIAIDENTPWYTPAHTYYSSNTDTVNTGLFFQSLGSGAINPDPLNPPSGTLTMQTPVLQLYFEETCSLPWNFQLDSLQPTSAHFSWIPLGDTLLWNLRFKQTNDTLWTEYSNLSNLYCSISNLFSINSYVAQVQANCGTETSEWSNPIYFNTPAIPGMRYSVDWEVFKNQTIGSYNIMNSNQPDLIVKLDSINTPNYSTGMDKFFSRIRGYIVPRKSGIYTFYFACDDIGQFWLSSDTSVANSVLVFNLDSAQTDWNQNVSNQTLVAGNKYYFEILHYDSVYTDLIKLGWKTPGSTSPVTISTPYIVSGGDNILANSFCFKDTMLMSYSGWTIQCDYYLKPWNVSNSAMIFQSSNTSIATVNSSGAITAVAQGDCYVFAKVASDTTLTDTLHFVVSDYYGPFFVKPDSLASGDGHSWDDAISLTKLLDFLNQGQHTQIATINVSEGYYKPTNTIDRNISFKLDNVILKGGYSINSTGTDTLLQNVEQYPTILSGEIGQPDETYDNSYHVVFAVRNVVIDGVIIKDGRASCSSYGYTTGTYSYKPDDNGGGIYTPFYTISNVVVRNSAIIYNSAWNGGAGILCGRGSINVNNSTNVTLINTEISNNIIEQTLVSTGSIFNIQINGYGPGISAITSKVTIENCVFFNNFTAAGYGKALYCEGAIAKMNNTSIFNNNGAYDDIRLNSGSKLYLDNSTIDGSITAFSNAILYIENSTISDGGYSGGGNNTISVSNTIWSGINLNSIPDTSLLTIDHSIVGNLLLGNSKNDIVLNNLSSCMSFLDTIAYNGGLTPTMRLKNIPFNPAKSMGNPIYIDSLDQRGFLRKDSVSIGAYQWIRPDSVLFGATPLPLCQGDSSLLNVAVFPVYADNPAYSLIGLNDSIAFVDSSYVFASSAGVAQIVVTTVEGNASDTLQVVVTGTVGAGIINGDSIVCQGDGPVMYQVTPIENATSYLWSLPSGASGSSTGNSIEIDYDLTAVSGNLSIIGQNNCFDGPQAILPVTVNEKPATPIITFNFDTLHSNAVAGNQWYNENGLISGATSQNYIVTANGNYFVIVSVNGCDSDPSAIIPVTNVGINESTTTLTIFPNPATNQIRIEGISGGNLRLYDLTGKLLLQQENIDNTMNLTGISAGSYVIEWRSVDGVGRGRVVVE